MPPNSSRACCVADHVGGCHHVDVLCKEMTRRCVCCLFLFAVWLSKCHDRLAEVFRLPGCMVGKVSIFSFFAMVLTR